METIAAFSQNITVTFHILQTSSLTIRRKSASGTAAARAASIGVIIDNCVLVPATSIASRSDEVWSPSLYMEQTCVLHSIIISL